MCDSWLSTLREGSEYSCCYIEALNFCVLWRHCACACCQEAFEGLESDADEDLEIEQMTQDYTNRGGTVIGQLIVSSFNVLQISLELHYCLPYIANRNSNVLFISANVFLAKVKSKKRKAAADDSDSGMGDNASDPEVGDNSEAEEASDYDDSELLTSKQRERQEKAAKKRKLVTSENDAENGDVVMSASSDDDLDTDDSSDDDDEAISSMTSSSQLTSAKQLRRERKKEALNKSHQDGFEIVSADAG